mmetsp:Transcript_15437/g.28564  ORF Transcript_15437/g.28564 Transcript_15437/m.28564 type:complete len:292 (-) Transcript_15437:1249-2124(-)
MPGRFNCACHSSASWRRSASSAAARACLESWSCRDSERTAASVCSNRDRIAAFSSSTRLTSLMWLSCLLAAPAAAATSKRCASASCDCKSSRSFTSFSRSLNVTSFSRWASASSDRQSSFARWASASSERKLSLSLSASASCDCTSSRSFTNFSRSLKVSSFSRWASASSDRKSSCCFTKFSLSLCASSSCDFKSSRSFRKPSRSLSISSFWRCKSENSFCISASITTPESSLIPTLISALFSTSFARFPKSSEQRVSSRSFADGEQVMIRQVLELPPKHSANNRVSIESR